MRDILDRVPIADLIQLARRKAVEDVGVERIARDYNKSAGLKGASRVTPSALRRALRTVPSKHESNRQEKLRQWQQALVEGRLWQERNMSPEELAEYNQTIEQWRLEDDGGHNDQSS